MGPGRQEFRDGGERLFQAQVINASYRLPDGAWLLEAVTGDRPPQSAEGRDVVTRDGKPFMDASPRQLWIVSQTGKARLLSPQNMAAHDALPSPDGTWVAYSAGKVGEGNVIERERLYLCERATRTTNMLLQGDARSGDYYFLRPRTWSDDSRTFTVWEGWGEIGSRSMTHTFEVPSRER